MKKYTVSVLTALMLTFSGCGGGGGSSAAPSTDGSSVSLFSLNEVVVSKQLNLPATTNDSDNDGMTDQAEIKYGYNPNDASSFPTEVAYNNADELKKVNIATGATVTYVNTTAGGVSLSWTNTATTNFVLHLEKQDSTVIYNGGHYINYADVSYNRFNLAGTEVLTGYFMEVNASSGYTIATHPTFTIDLNDYQIVGNVGDSANYISYTFKDFDDTNKALYRDFLKKVWPLMRERLGAPAESFNCEITNMGANSDYFMVVNSGRTFLSSTAFIPRLLVHEFIHAWKGNYLITSGADWEYDTKLSGFEESLAEGFAFEIIQDYTKAYPNDYATQVLLANKPHQYNSGITTTYDLFKLQRNTGAGDYWTLRGSDLYRYSSSATTMQIISKEYPHFYRDTQALIYQAINADKDWRPTRANILTIWQSVAPTVQGVALDKFLNALPVFQGTALTDGFYIQNLTKQFSTSGEQAFSLSYALNGREWWNINDTTFNSSMVPSGLNYVIGDDHWVYPDTQGEAYTYSIYTNNTTVKSGSSITSKSYINDKPANTGWDSTTDLQQANYDIGMYKAEIEFTKFAGQTGAKESFYFFGYKNQTLDTTKTNLAFGIDTVDTNLTMTLDIDGLVKKSVVKNSMGLFTYGNELPKGFTGVMSLTVDNSGQTCTYKRTLLDAVTYDNVYQHYYVVIDRDFDCIEDIYEDL